MLSEGDKRGIEVYIARDDGTRFTEHRVENTEGGVDTPSTTSCFLESEEGSTFAIVVEMATVFALHPNHDWSVEFYVDGRKIDNPVYSKGHWKTRKIKSLVSKDGDQLVEGKLTFAKLQTTDKPEEVTYQTDHLRSLGQITVDFPRGTKGKSRRGQLSPVKDHLGVASENWKKLGGSVSDSSSTAKVPYTAIQNLVDWKAFDVQKPFHRVTFNYRTRPVLEIMNIVEPTTPHDSAGSSSKRKRNSSGLDQEGGGDDAVDEKPSRKALLAAKLKEVERQVERLAKRSRGQADIEVVDLTGDD